jgi:hypothetical protein
LIIYRGFGPIGEIMKISAQEVNTGGGSMVTIIECDQWDYIIVTSDEAVAAYASEDAFWDGSDPINSTFIKE